MHIKVCSKAIIKRDSRLLILQRSASDDIGPGDWEFPGGTVEWNETPEQAIRREIEEELGVYIDKCNLAYVSTVFINDSLKMFVINYVVSISGDICLSEEHQQLKWADDNTARELLVPGIYHDYIQFIARRGNEQESKMESRVGNDF